MSEKYFTMDGLALKKKNQRIKQKVSYYLGNWDGVIDLVLGRQGQIAMNLILHGKFPSLQRSSRER